MSASLLRFINRVLIGMVICLFLLLVVQSYPQTMPANADAIVSKMMEADAQRQCAMSGYTAVRRYSASNHNRHAEMVVQVLADEKGAKQFTVTSEQGSGAIRKHVFIKMLSEEAEASKYGSRGSTRLIPANYQFVLRGKDMLETGPAYVFDVTPKTLNKYLIEGKIWIDANDYSIVRVEGQPARSPSFWVRSVHFTHTYQKVGQFWLASSTHSVSDIKIFGTSELTIENSSYKLRVPDASPPVDLEPAAPVRTQRAANRPEREKTRVSQ
jgi:hypothetical protein